MAFVVARELLGPDGDLEDVAAGAVVDELLHPRHQGMKAHAVGDHENYVCCIGGPDQFETLDLGDGHRLFYEDVLAGTQKIHGHRMVLVVGKNQ